MTRAEFDDKQFDLSVMAGMNQRYHQAKANRWAQWDRSLRIAVGILAVAGAMLSVWTITSPDFWSIVFSVLISSVAAIVAVVLNVIPIADWERRHLDMFRRWSDFREEIDALQFVTKLSDEAIARLTALDAKSHRLCALEPAPDQPFLNQCFKQEEASRHPQTDAAIEEPMAATA